MGAKDVEMKERIGRLELRLEECEKYERGKTVRESRIVEAKLSQIETDGASTCI